MCCDRKLTKNRRETRSDILQRQALFRGVKQLLTRSGNKKRLRQKKEKNNTARPGKGTVLYPGYNIMVNGYNIMVNYMFF